jgi:hypothetical protein
MIQQIQSNDQLCNCSTLFNLNSSPSLLSSKTSTYTTENFWFVQSCVCQSDNSSDHSPASSIENYPPEHQSIDHHQHPISLHNYAQLLDLTPQTSSTLAVRHSRRRSAQLLHSGRQAQQHLLINRNNRSTSSSTSVITTSSAPAPPVLNRLHSPLKKKASISSKQ